MKTSERLGPYRLDELIGQGGTAQVYKAWHTNLHRFEALKVLTDSMAYEPTVVARFLKEARTAAKLHHPFIAAIYSVGGGSGSQPYFTMEMVEGQNLGEYLKDFGPLTLAEAAPLLHQIAEAVDYAHGVGVVHRDIKPANILLGGLSSGELRVKLVDFGIAQTAQEEAAAQATQNGGIVGTPKYISPEQASQLTVDYRADIYSFGVVAYEMLCGRTPFDGPEPATTMAVLMAHVHNVPPDPRDFTPALPHPAAIALLRSLAKAPKDRFTSCGEFVRDLTASVQTDAPIATPSAIPTPPVGAAIRFAEPPAATFTPPPMTIPETRSRRALLAPIGAAVGSAVVVLTILILTHPATPPPAHPAHSAAGVKPKTMAQTKAAAQPKTAAPLKAAAQPKAAAPAPSKPLLPTLTPIHETQVVLPIAPKLAAAPPVKPALAAAIPAPLHATAPILPKPAPTPVVHAPAPPKPVALTPKPTTPKPVPAPTKPAPRIVKAHAPIFTRRVRVSTHRRKPQPHVNRVAKHPVKGNTMAEAWQASYRKEMALSHSYRAKGDMVQANALAQNAEDSRHHAANAPKIKAKVKKRKGRR